MSVLADATRGDPVLTFPWDWPIHLSSSVLGGLTMSLLGEGVYLWLKTGSGKILEFYLFRIALIRA